MHVPPTSWPMLSLLRLSLLRNTSPLLQALREVTLLLAPVVTITYLVFLLPVTLLIPPSHLPLAPVEVLLIPVMQSIGPAARRKRLRVIPRLLPALKAMLWVPPFRLRIVPQVLSMAITSPVLPPLVVVAPRRPVSRDLTALRLPSRNLALTMSPLLNGLIPVLFLCMTPLLLK